MRLRGSLLALALAAGLVTAVGPAEAATPSRCAAYDAVVRETSAGGVQAGRTPLLVGSYNITGYNTGSKQPKWEHRSGRVIDMIMRCSPDVIGLQEASGAWMMRRPSGQRNHVQYEQVVDLMNARTPGSPYRVTNTYRENCRTTGTNLPIWNGTWKGHEADWRTCTASSRLSSSDNRTVYDSRILTLVDHGVGHLPSAGSNPRTVDWNIFAVRETGRLFLFANTHLEARYRGKAVGTKVSNAFRRKEAAVVKSTLASARQFRGQTLPVVLVGDLNSTGRYRGTTAVDDLTRAGYTDLLGTDRRVTRTKRSSYRGSCASVGVVTSLASANRRVPLHVTRRLHAYYNSTNAGTSGKPGAGVNHCMYRTAKHRKTRGSTPSAYYRYQGIRIDYVLASAPFMGRGWETVVDARLKTARYSRTPPSDHNMIAATLAF